MRDRILRLTAVLAVAAVVNAPWWVPALLRPADLPVDPASADVFAARAEGPGGVLTTLLTGGGIWNADVVPAERASILVFSVSVAVAVVGVLGLVAQHRRGNRGSTALALAGAGGVAVALLGVLWPQGARELVTAFPGAGLLRDAHKLVAPWAMAVAVGTGGALTWLTGRRGRPRELVPPAAALLVASVVLTLPSMATGLEGRLDPVTYPADYPRTADELARRSGPDQLAVVLPWQPYRAYDWTDGRTVLDPLPRWLSTTAVTDDDLTVGARTVSGEGPLADRLDPILTGPGPVAGPLADKGVTWVLVERRTGTPPVPAGVLDGLVPVRRGPDLELWRVPGADGARGAQQVSAVRPPLAPVVVADVLAGLFVLAAAVVVGVRFRVGRRL